MRTTKAASHNLSFSVALSSLGLRIVVQDVAASFSDALLRQPYLRPRRCGDFGLVSWHKPAEHHFLMFPPRNSQCTRSSSRVEAKSTSSQMYRVSVVGLRHWEYQDNRTSSRSDRSSRFLGRSLEQESCVGHMLPVVKQHLPQLSTVWPMNSDHHGDASVTAQESEQLAGHCLVPVRCSTYDEPVPTSRA